MSRDTFVVQTPVEDDDIVPDTLMLAARPGRMGRVSNPQVADATNAAKAAAGSSKKPAIIFGLVSLAVCAALAAYCYYDYEALRAAGKMDKDVGLFFLQSTLDMLSWVFLTFSFYMGVIVLLPVIVVFVRRRIRNNCGKTWEQHVADGMPIKDITVVIPCFLPNEQDIIEDTINWVMDNVKSPAGLKVFVVYNTPKDIPEVEARLQELGKRKDWKDGRELQVLRVWTSKSKAENLNYVLPKISTEHFVIYDADHNPDPDSLMRLWEDMWVQKADIAQGSTYIRNLDFGFMARFIDAEFFVLYYLIFPAAELWTRIAVFGGSNALICKACLEGKEFSHSMQTEDIDLSIRLHLAGKKITFSAEARSGELVPPSFTAYYKQRLRWALGWDQVSFHYARQVVSSNLSCFKKFALIQWLYIRWGTPIAMVMMLLLKPTWMDLKDGGQTDPYVKKMGTLVFIMMFASPTCGIIEAIIQSGHRGRETVKQIFWVLVYFIAGIPLVLWMGLLILISMYKIFTGNAGGWVVTGRSNANLQALKTTASSAWLGTRSGSTPNGTPYGSKNDLSTPLVGA